MGFLSIEPGPIFRQTYSRHTSASPDKRGVWTHASTACCPKCRKQPLPSYTVRQSDNQEGKMIRLPRGHFPPQEIPSIVVFKAGYESVPSNESPSMPQNNPVYHNRAKNISQGRHSGQTTVGMRRPTQTRRHIKSRIKGGRKELRLPSITYTYHEKDDSLS